MLSRIFLCTICAVAITTPAFAKDKPASAEVEPVACAGVYGSATTEDLIVETFGAENVTTGLVDGPEGSQYTATTVYPGDPQREMIFSWFDEENLEKISNIQLSPSQAGPHGVRLGMSAADVEAINGQPFDIGGFWWDYGGSASIDEGTLAGPMDGDCYVIITFSPQDDIPASIDVTPASGEVVVRSDLPLLAEIGTRVTGLSIGYALEPEE